MFKGVVKWFNDAKGYGFILSKEKNEDLFVHFSSIIMQGFKTLKEGQKVKYEIVETPKGKQASKVCVDCEEETNAGGVFGFDKNN